jgi:hypothetical protein
MPERPEKLYKYTFHIITNPPMYEILAGVSKVEWKIVTAYGTSREDALKRAGIEEVRHNA